MPHAQGTLHFGEGAASPSAAAPAQAEDKASKLARGTLTHGRQADIERSESGLMNLVHNWDNRAIVSQANINKMKHSQKDLITEHMRPIVLELGKAKHLSTVKGQFRNYFDTAAHEPVRCFELHGVHIESLLQQTVGDILPVQLKTAVNDSTLGRLNKYLLWLRAFASEEMDAKIRHDLKHTPLHYARARKCYAHATVLCKSGACRVCAVVRR